MAEAKPTALAEIDLKNMPKVSPEEFKKQPAALKYHIEIVMKDSPKNMAFDIMGGEEASKFVDSYNKMVEAKAAIARWAIGGSMYTIPMESILFVRMDRPSAQELTAAQC